MKIKINLDSKIVKQRVHPKGEPFVVCSYLQNIDSFVQSSSGAKVNMGTVRGTQANDKGRGDFNFMILIYHQEQGWIL